ncbi:MAG: response regulator transcription factor [Chloroflexi bacterium]|nr:response regulator transcription factor [Chloroflexota bacterium]
MLRLRVAVIDSQRLFCMGIASALEKAGSVEVAAEPPDSKSLFSTLRRTRPQVAIVGILAHETGGLGVVKAMRHTFPRTSVVLLTEEEGAEQLLLALKAGAVACYPRAVSPRELAWGVTHVAMGQTLLFHQLWRHPRAALLLLREFPDLGQKVEGSLPDGLVLPARERRILVLLAEGLGTAEVAAALALPTEAVGNALRATLARLQARCRRAEGLPVQSSPLW